jgi:hypothetical protein
MDNAPVGAPPPFSSGGFGRLACAWLLTSSDAKGIARTKARTFIPLQRRLFEASKEKPCEQRQKKLFGLLCVGNHVFKIGSRNLAFAF